MPSEKCWVGIDGTRSGWVVAVLREELSLDLYHVSALSRVVETFGPYGVPHAIGIDIPIGLLEHAERGGRGCDREARRILSSAKRRSVKETGKKSCVPYVGPSSIFTPPARPALEVFANGGSHSSVSAANVSSSRVEKEGGLGLSIQTYHIMTKILETDKLLRKGDATSARLEGIPTFECHPELAFLALAQHLSKRESDVSKLAEKGALLGKKHVKGRQQRLELLRKNAHVSLPRLSALTREGHLQDLTAVAAQNSLGGKQTWHIRGDACGRDEKWVSVAADDVLDAIVCAVSAKRYAQSEVVRISEKDDSPTDSHGFPIVIQV